MLECRSAGFGWLPTCRWSDSKENSSIWKNISLTLLRMLWLRLVHLHFPVDCVQQWIVSKRIVFHLLPDCSYGRRSTLLLITNQRDAYTSIMRQTHCSLPFHPYSPFHSCSDGVLLGCNMPTKKGTSPDPWHRSDRRRYHWDWFRRYVHHWSEGLVSI